MRRRTPSPPIGNQRLMLFAAAAEKPSPAAPQTGARKGNAYSGETKQTKEPDAKIRIAFEARKSKWCRSKFHFGLKFQQKFSVHDLIDAPLLQSMSPSNGGLSAFVDKSRLHAHIADLPSNLLKVIHYFLAEEKGRIGGIARKRKHVLDGKALVPGRTHEIRSGRFIDFEAPIEQVISQPDIS